MRLVKALIICQAGIEVGLGHLTRCLVVAKMLRTRFDTDVQLLIQSDPLVREDLDEFTHQFIGLDDDLAAEIARQSSMDLLILDFHPKLVPDRLRKALDHVRSTRTKLIAIDGLLEYRSQLDLIFIPSFQFTPPQELSEGAPIVYGWDCLLLDSALRPKPWSPGQQRVLALTGGSDATQLGAHWPTILNQQLPIGAMLDWVTGPFSSRPSWPASPRIEMVEHVAPSGLGILMQQANYAVTVFGVSFFELLYQGVPTVVFSPYKDRDSVELTAIKKAGVALVATNEDDSIDLLVKLMDNDVQARSLSDRARNKSEGSGAERLGSEIVSVMQC